MSNYLFILGAGASKDAGAPLMNDFIPKAREFQNSNFSSSLKNDYDRMLTAINNLKIINYHSDMDLFNIETVFALFEFGKMICKIPGEKKEEYEELINSTKKVICSVLENSIEFEFKQKMSPTKTYDRFCQLLKDLTKKGKTFSIITFNYDIALDFALECNDLYFDYCHKPKSSIREKDINYLKLHGSLNWGKLKNDNEIFSVRITDFLKKISIAPDHETKKIYIPIGTRLSEYATLINRDIEPIPIIVPPTWNKTQYQETISIVWKKAVEELEKAENIVVIGYSLPESDLFFKYLYALGTTGEKFIQNFLIIDPNFEKILPRYEAMLGSNVRKNLTHDKSFDDWLKSRIKESKMPFIFSA